MAQITGEHNRALWGSRVMPSRLFGYGDPELMHIYPYPLGHRLLKLAIRLYLQRYHDLSVEFPSGLPQVGPYLVLTSHFSLLDVPAIITADPYYPWTGVVVKRSMMKVPVVRQLLQYHRAVEVDRDGQDIGAVRRILRILVEEKRGICVAAQGTRSRTGRLGPMHPSLMRLVAHAAARGIPVFPVVEVGTYEALPPGARFPRPHPIRVILGNPITFPALRPGQLGKDEVEDVAELAQRSLSELLPAERRPSPGTLVVAPTNAFVA